MLTKENRITRKKDFEEISKGGVKKSNDLMIIKTLHNNLNVSRFGIIVGGRISKKAVERNKIKRKIRNIIQKNLNNIIIGVDFVIICLPLIIQSKNNTIEEKIIDLLKRSKAIK